MGPPPLVRTSGRASMPTGTPTNPSRPIAPGSQEPVVVCVSADAVCAMQPTGGGKFSGIPTKTPLNVYVAAVGEADGLS
jgi:hypothetical protein